MKKQASSTIWMGILLALSGGLMDAYSYLFRGKVFANAQTGNILLFSVSLSQGEWRAALNYACPILAFSFGIAAAAVIRHLCPKNSKIHWRQLCVLFEAAALLSAALFPQSANLIANSLISLACGTQVETFRTIEGSSVATTMCIGNLRLAVHSLIAYGVAGRKDDQKSAGVSIVVILAFAVGAVIGSVLIRWLGTYTIWASTAILLLCFAAMFAKPAAGPGEEEELYFDKL